MRRNLLEVGQLRMKVRTVKDPLNDWLEQEALFDDYFDAVQAAVNLRYGWQEVIGEIDVRMVNPLHME
jgi:hypothetical protein